jgi:predicted metal-binding membrane protein
LGARRSSAPTQHKDWRYAPCYVTPACIANRRMQSRARMASASNVLGGIVRIAAGVYQWTPLKDVCLAQCQTPLQFLIRRGGFRGDVPGCLLLGLRHGGYCVGCC